MKQRQKKALDPVPTKNKRLNAYIKKFWSLTLELDSYFVNIPSYEDRLEIYRDTWLPALNKIRGSFYREFCQDSEFKKDFLTYLTTTQDYITWFNSLLSSPDQRKFGEVGEDIPFILYPYQVVILGLSDHFNLALLKSRDIGASQTFSGKGSFHLSVAQKWESLYLSEKQDKVDISGDRTQTLMGRLRRFLESTKIINLKKFYIDKFLHLWRDKQCKVDGASMTPTATNSARYREIVCDEFGLIRFSGVFLSEAMAATDRIFVFGTLKSGQDAGFRNVLKKATVVDHRKIFARFYTELVQGKKASNQIWKEIAQEIKEEYNLPKKGFIKLKINFQDHPLKKGDCDYLEMESNALLNNPTAIALQLWADENAGSTERSLELADPFIHFNHASNFAKNIVDVSKWHMIEIGGGFDPGGHKAAFYVPVLTDPFGFSYVLPPEQFKSGSMKQWMVKIADKFGRQSGKKVNITADNAILQYAKEGALWSSVIRKKEIEKHLSFRAVSNRNIEDMVTAVNGVLHQRKVHPVTGELLPLITFAEENREWVMGYELGGKYGSDKLQKGWSHPHDAFIYWCFNYYKDVLDMDTYYFGGA